MDVGVMAMNGYSTSLKLQNSVFIFRYYYYPRHSLGKMLLLCGDSVGVFYSHSRLDERKKESEQKEKKEKTKVKKKKTKENERMNEKQNK